MFSSGLPVSGAESEGFCCGRMMVISRVSGSAACPPARRRIAGSSRVISSVRLPVRAMSTVIW